MKTTLLLILLSAAAWGQTTTPVITATGQLVCPQGKTCKLPKPEPVDVPAIHGKPLKGECWGDVGMSVCATENVTEPTWTCADRKRILEHDEQEPPVYWCRKVEDR